MSTPSLIGKFFTWIVLLFSSFYWKAKAKDKIKKLDNFIRDKIGVVRCSGTHTVLWRPQLPLTYLIDEQTISQDYLVFHCTAVLDGAPGPLVWRDANSITVQGMTYSLARSPSRITEPDFFPTEPMNGHIDRFQPEWSERLKFTVRR